MQDQRHENYAQTSDKFFMPETGKQTKMLEALPTSSYIATALNKKRHAVAHGSNTCLTLTAEKRRNFLVATCFDHR